MSRTKKIDAVDRLIAARYYLWQKSRLSLSASAVFNAAAHASLSFATDIRATESQEVLGKRGDIFAWTSMAAGEIASFYHNNNGPVSTVSRHFCPFYNASVLTLAF